MRALNIGIAGGGIGGLTAAIALQQRGHTVTVYEQAPQWMRVGADVNLTPNVVRALDGLGGNIGERIRKEGAQPTYRISRDWDTDIQMGKIDIDYQTLHDAFFKYANKPKMTTFGDMYYEGKEYEIIKSDFKTYGYENSADECHAD